MIFSNCCKAQIVYDTETDDTQVYRLCSVCKKDCEEIDCCPHGNTTEDCDICHNTKITHEYSISYDTAQTLSNSLKTLSEGDALEITLKDEVIKLYVIDIKTHKNK